MSAIFFYEKTNKVPATQREFVIKERINKETGNIDYIKIKNPSYKSGDTKNEKNNEEENKEEVLLTITEKEYIEDRIEEMKEIKELLDF